MYDPYKKLMQPDFGAQPQQQGWVNMPEDEPIDMGPAASAFKQRFMQPSAGDTRGVPNTNDLPEMPDMGMDGGGGAPVGGLGGKLKGGLKSL